MIEEQSESIIYKLTSQITKMKNRLSFYYTQNQVGNKVEILEGLLKKKEQRLKKEFERIKMESMPWEN